jgi:hypothetical protein
MASERNVVKVCDTGETLFVAPAAHEEYRGQFTHITLPLDPAQYDDAAVEAAARVIDSYAFKHPERLQHAARHQQLARDDARRVLAAYARTVAGGAR